MTDLASTSVALPMVPAEGPQPETPTLAAPPPATTEPSAPDIDAIAARLDEAQARMVELDPLPRQILKDHIAALDELHQAGLKVMVRRLRDDPAGKELLFDLVEDPLVRMLLSMHGVIRSADPMVLAEKVLETIRPGIASHGGDVQLSHIDEGVAYVRLSGACNGCSMAGVTMRQGVEKALVEGIPSITSVEVLPNDPQQEAAPVLQITQVGGNGDDSAASTASAEETGWFKTFPVERIAEGTLEAMSLQPAEAASVEVIVVNAAGKLAAYINACAHQGMPLDKAIVDAEEGTLTCPWHGFCFDSTSGECLTMPGAQLEQLPLRVQDGHVWVRASS